MVNDHVPTSSTAAPAAIAAEFTPGAGIVSVTPHGGGLINDSYLVRRRGQPSLLLQRLNPEVFPQPQLLLHNLRRVSDHLSLKSEQTGLGKKHQAVTMLTTRHGEDYFCDKQGHYWRALLFIEHSRTLPGLENPRQANEAGAILGRFHALLHDLPPARLYDPLPTFHVVPSALARYRRLRQAQPAGRVDDETAFCREFIDQRQEAAAVLEQARSRGILPERVIHGDPKLDNILFAEDEERALALVDYDTLKPGLTQYDIGDCLRSCCNPHGEEARQPVFELELAHALLSGYLSEMRALLTYSDFAYIYDACRLLTFELGLRFFSDFLAGNLYFKVSDPEQNLRRAGSQFRLVASIEGQERALRATEA
ncbi:MAG: aminoglycoside phosphotransferase family protein [Desulfurivibrio sp.]|nr:aminoglycoside phosphotransferase family protein [Desulfurivibrio sp.]